MTARMFRLAACLTLALITVALGQIHDRGDIGHNPNEPTPGKAAPARPEAERLCKPLEAEVTNSTDAIVVLLESTLKRGRLSTRIFVLDPGHRVSYFDSCVTFPDDQPAWHCRSPVPDALRVCPQHGFCVDLWDCIDGDFGPVDPLIEPGEPAVFVIHEDSVSITTPGLIDNPGKYDAVEYELTEDGVNATGVKFLGNDE